LKDARKMILVSSTTEWTELQQKIAAVLDVFPTSLQAQCILPGDKSTDLKISLMSQEDLNDLHLELRAKIVPPQNANGKHSKHKHKEITISVTDKNEDKLSVNAGKVCRGILFCFMQCSLYSERRAKGGLISPLTHQPATCSKTSKQRKQLFAKQSRPFGSAKPIPMVNTYCSSMLAR